MNGTGEVFQEVPDSHSEVEVEQVEVVNFGQVVDVVALESHSEVRGFKDVGKNVGIVDRIIRDNMVLNGDGDLLKTKQALYTLCK